MLLVGHRKYLHLFTLSTDSSLETPGSTRDFCMEKTPSYAAAQASGHRMAPGTKHLYESSLVLYKCHRKGFAGPLDQMIGKVQGNAGRSRKDMFTPYHF